MAFVNQQVSQSESSASRESRPQKSFFASHQYTVTVLIQDVYQRVSHFAPTIGGGVPDRSAVHDSRKWENVRSHSAGASNSGLTHFRSFQLRKKAATNPRVRVTAWRYSPTSRIRTRRPARKASTRKRQASSQCSIQPDNLILLFSSKLAELLCVLAPS